MSIGLLGTVTAHVDGRQVDLGPARQRCVLAALAVDAGRVVPVERLIDRVWGDGARQRARATVHSYLSRLRSVLPGADIVRRGGGYALLGCDTDLLRFRDLVDRAGGDEARALTEALGLWRGDALTGLDGDWARAERELLRRERLAAETELVTARLRLGQGAELLAGLSARAEADPLDERAAREYMLALSRSGRATDALAHYRRLCERLAADLGMEPGSGLRELHGRILADAPARRPEPTPFVGRRAELDLLDTARSAVVAICGAGGTGKTSLALHWARGHTGEYPDGLLFVDLGSAVDPTVALGEVLVELGVEPARLPLDQHTRAALFRSLVAARKLVLVLDDAAGTSQVVPLLPGSGTSAVVVTSRDPLPGLEIGHGARRLLLDALSDTEAHALLAARLGSARLTAAPETTAAVIALCQGFPAALDVVAANTTGGLDGVVAELAVESRGSGVAAEVSGGPAAVLSWALRARDPDQVRMFALLGRAPGPDVDLDAASALAGLPALETGKLMRGLVSGSLVEVVGDRYRMSEPVRRFASLVPLADSEIRSALRRVVDHHLRTGHVAVRQSPAERRCLLAAWRTAVSLGWEREASLLARVLDVLSG